MNECMLHKSRLSAKIKVSELNPMYIHDWHATVLHLLGLDHTKLTYSYGGRNFRLTNVSGEVAQKILA